MHKSEANFQSNPKLLKDEYEDILEEENSEDYDEEEE